jgi:hypothetical protein
MSVPFDLWGQRGWAGFDVVGESHYKQSIRSLFDAVPKGDGAELTVTVQLVPDPKNKFDRHAVGVWAGPRQLGFLPRDQAVRYAPVLSSLVSEGWAPQVSARVWAAERGSDYGTRGDFNASIRLDLAEPHLLVPVNPPPGGPHRLLPRGGSIQVTGEEQHLDALAPWLRPEGECWVHATLHEVTEQLTRTSRTVVEVRIDEARVGQLTPKMSGELLPAIRHLRDNHLAAVARAIVQGNRIKSEVVLHVVRAHELPESWLSTVAGASARATALVVPGQVVSGQPAAAAPAPVREHEPIPPPPIGIKFVVPPDWPQPPTGWTPPPGWRPEPTWPPAPYGWQWWIPVWE